MLRKVVLLLIVAVLLASAVGCSTYNNSNMSSTAHLRRITILGEQLRLAHQDADRVLGLENYPMSGRYNN